MLHVNETGEYDRKELSTKKTYLWIRLLKVDNTCI